MGTRLRLPIIVAAIATVMAACSSGSSRADHHPDTTAPPSSVVPVTTPIVATNTIPGMPPVVDPTNIYSEITPDKLQPALRAFPRRVFVPNTISNTVSIIDADSKQVIGRFRTGREPQHAVPSYDFRTIWILDNQGYDAIPVDPVTGEPGERIPVEDPYNLYFTPDGKQAVVVAEKFRRLDFYTPDLRTLTGSLDVPECDGINHGDWSADGRYALFTCEFNGKVSKVDLINNQVLGYLDLGAETMPQDLRFGPDGKTVYIAEMMTGGVHVIDPESFTRRGFIPTGVGAHGITISRDAKRMFIANRGTTQLPGRAQPGGEGSLSIFDLATNTVTKTIPVPDGGSPDMGNMNPEGTELWLGGRFDDEVYVFTITPGQEAFLTRIPVEGQPHGLAYSPQPGRYSLGHTGNVR